MIVLNMEQGSDEWFKEKLGKPSASRGNEIITSQGKQSKQREGYLYTLAGELITGERDVTFTNAAIEQGNDRELESSKLYEMMKDVEIIPVGVIYKDDQKKILCSPDGICGDGICSDYGLELKNVLQKTQVKRLLKGTLPTEYFVQIQFSLYITGFKHWDFCSYCPGLKPLIVTVERDDKFIKALDLELNLFCKDLKDIVSRIK